MSMDTSTNRKTGRPWTREENEQLIEMARKHMPTKTIADRFNRTESAIRSQASKQGVSLRPPSRSAYGMR